MKILFHEPQGIPYFDRYIDLSGHSGSKDSFPMPMVYFGQAFDYSGSRPICPYIKAGKAIGPHSRIRGYNQSGIDFRIWALYRAEDYSHAARIERRLQQQFQHHRVTVPGRGNRELYDFRVEDLSSIIDRITAADRVQSQVLARITQ